MKVHIRCLVVLLVVAVSCFAQNDFQDEDEPKAPARPLLLRRPVGLPTRGKVASTTTTTPPPPKIEEEEEEFDEEAAGDEEEAHEEPTTTPPSKKIKSVVRPFRSNDDLLATLKRRRAEAVSGKAHHNEATSAPSAAEAPAETQSSAKNSNAGRKRYNLNPKSEATTEASSPSSPAVARSRNRFSGRALYKPNAAEGGGEITGLESNNQAVEVKARSGFKPGQRRF